MVDNESTPDSGRYGHRERIAEAVAGWLNVRVLWRRGYGLGFQYDALGRKRWNLRRPVAR